MRAAGNSLRLHLEHSDTGQPMKIPGPGRISRRFDRGLSQLLWACAGPICMAFNEGRRGSAALSMVYPMVLGHGRPAEGS